MFPSESAARDLPAPLFWKLRRLWSNWEMIVLRPLELMNLLQAIIGSEEVVRDMHGPLPATVVDTTRLAARKIEALASSLGLPVTAATARNMFAPATTSQEFHRAVTQLGNTLFMEMGHRKFYGPLEQFAKYFENDRLFGDDVFAKFSSANDDIYEAGTCLALERGTASVMHCMRIMEAGLAALV